MRSILFGLALLSTATVASMSASAQTAQPGTTIADLIAGAKAEGKLVIWISSPAIPGTHAALVEAFNKRFGLSAQYEWLSLHPSRSVPRLITEAKNGRVDADVVGTFSYDDMLALQDANLLKPYPWDRVFGKDLPGIKEPFERMIPELRGKGLAFFDNVFVLAWNTNQIKEADLPRKLYDLTDAKWKGRFVTNSTYGLPLDTLSIALGKDETLALARKLLDNRPVLKSGTPAVAEAVTAGEAPVGISSFFNSDKARKLGAPHSFRLFEDYVPVMPLSVVVPEGAAHPNTARLFAAWLVSEGVKIVDKLESSGRVSDPDSAMGQMIVQRAAGAKLVMPQNLKEVGAILEVRRDLNLLFTGR